MAFTAKDVMALREKTGAGVMDCKKALTDADGDMNKAADLLRERGIHMKIIRVKSYEELREFDLKGAWEGFLTSFFEEQSGSREVSVNQEESNLLLTTLLEHYDKGCRKNGEEAEYAFLRGLWKLGRLYRFWKENGLRKTKDIIVRKIGDIHDKN